MIKNLLVDLEAESQFSYLKEGYIFVWVFYNGKNEI